LNIVEEAHASSFRENFADFRILNGNRLYSPDVTESDPHSHNGGFDPVEERGKVVFYGTSLMSV
jgi:hypothetical protein